MGKDTAARAAQAPPLARKAEILTRARRPIHIDLTRQKVIGHGRDIALMQCRLPPILGIDLAFHRVDIVGQHALPPVLQGRAHHATAAEKLGVRRGLGGVIRHIY